MRALRLHLAEGKRFCSTCVCQMPQPVLGCAEEKEEGVRLWIVDAAVASKRQAKQDLYVGTIVVSNEPHVQQG